MKHTVIGTAGHIDHGKTALLKALTGYDADRLPEEKERCMTIDLGFVFFGRNVTIIDVPGHEKFIKNMLAGVSTIDFVIFVIAADDGIMPQTREHFEILQLLEINRGIIALTKIDLVDKELLDILIEDINAFVKGTFLENAPIIPVSNITGEGIPEFKKTLIKTIDETPPKSDKGIFRMWIDRIFSLKGIGTIVAGTVLSGTLKAGDWIEILPQSKKVRARSIQLHDENVEESHTGERAAINLIGIDKSEIERGNLLGEIDYFDKTYMANAKLHLLKSAKKPLKNRTRVRFHIGTKEVMARVVLLEKKVLDPGESTFVQFRFEAPVTPDYGDCYIIRSYSPIVTIGGGKILEVKPEKLKYLPEEKLKKLHRLVDEDPEELLLYILEKHPLVSKSPNQLATAISTDDKKITEIIDNLVNKNKITPITDKSKKSFLLTEHIEQTEDKIISFLEKYHKKHKLISGIKKSELKSTLFEKVDSTVFDFILNKMIHLKKLKFIGEKISLFEHKIKFTPKQEKIKNKIEDIYLNAKFNTPSFEEVAEEFPENKKDIISDVISGLIEQDTLVEIKSEEKPVIFHSKNIREAEKLLVDSLKQNKEIRLGEFRKMINSTRKFTTPLLNYFDDKNITYRDGDVRRLKNL